MKPAACHRLLPLATVVRFEPLARAQGVSKVARGPRGFLTAFKQGRLDDWWCKRRAGFVKRHTAQLRRNREPLWTSAGTPTRRHLALIMWAYTPVPAKTLRGRRRTMIIDSKL